MLFARIIIYLLIFKVLCGTAFARVEVGINQIDANSCILKTAGFVNVDIVGNELEIRFNPSSQPMIFNNCNFAIIDKQKRIISIKGGFASMNDCNSIKCVAFISKIAKFNNFDKKPNTNNKKVEQVKGRQEFNPIVQKKKNGKLLIAIDAGHGGKDPGAIGKYGTKEKDITLKYSMHLKQVLEKAGYEVFLTRASDEYVELYSRIDKAMQRNVDLFISIHADAAHNKEARGATIYALSPHAVNEATQKVESRTKISGNFLTKSNDKDLMFNILNIQHNSNVKQSFNFANLLKNNMQKNGVRFTASPVRSANFAVLKSPTFPAILLEIGYISNREDEKMVQSSQYMDKIAFSIRQSLDNKP